jgi:hypothetical protein
LPSQPVRIAPRPIVLAGREGLIAELDAVLSSEEGASPRFVALCGLGGAGKTSVALEYAHRHLAELGVVWQFAAEEATALSAGFSDLAAALGARDLLDSGDPIAAVHGALAVWPGTWLLLFDNVVDLTAIRGMLPPAGRGRVLITTQDPRWATGQVLEVPVLDVDTAAGFLVNRAGTPGQEAPARLLAAELGGLPLALEQAAAYIRATGLSMTGYLKLFRERTAELLARGDAAGYDKRVTTTWALAFSQIDRMTPEATGLLRLMACCAPDAIPLDLLLKPRPELADALGQEAGRKLLPLLEDKLAVADAVAALRRYSLISAPLDGSVSVHRLVQAVTLAQLSGEAAAVWRQAAASLVVAALPAEPRRRVNFPAFAALLPHARAVLDGDDAGMDKVTDYLLYRAHRALSMSRHPSRATAPAGRESAAEAREQFAMLKSVYEHNHGREDIRTLGAYQELALATRDAGDAAAARDQLEELLHLAERVFGCDHKATLTIHINLAVCTGEAGAAAMARDLLEALLPAIKRAYGPQNTAVMAIVDTIAYWSEEARLQDLC